MTTRRSATAGSYLARLLAELPRERLQSLQATWGLAEVAGRGLNALLYRQMTDERRRQGILDALGDECRLVFERLSTARRPMSWIALLRSLPFSEDGLAQSLAALEDCGLAWRYRPIGRDQSPSDQHWIVPVELCKMGLSVQRRSIAEQESREKGGPHVSPPGLVVLNRQPDVARPTGMVPRAIGTHGDQPPDDGLIETDLHAYAIHCGIALGVLARKGRRVQDGPRAEAWRKLDPVDRIRALLRLWLVDDRLPRPVPTLVRRAVAQVLLTLEEDTWYELDSIGRRLAWLVGTTGPRAEAVTLATGPVVPGQTIDRRDVELAVDQLGWIGVLTVAETDRGHASALRLTTEGRRALEGDQSGLAR